MELPELKPGSESSEYALAKNMMIAGLVLSVASSLGKVPFTPEALSAYLANIVAQATEWSKALMPYATLLLGIYTAHRHKLKSKHIDAQKAVAIKKIETAATTAALALFALLFMVPQIASAGQLSFGWTPNDPGEKAQWYMIVYGAEEASLTAGSVDCDLPTVLNNTMSCTKDYPRTVQTALLLRPTMTAGWGQKVT